MPRNSRSLSVFPITLRTAVVHEAFDLTPNMRRIVLTGDDLRAGTAPDGSRRPAFRTEGFDDHVKLVIPPASGDLPHIGTQRGFAFEWNRDVLVKTRDYTVREFDEAANLLTIDIARHDSGLASDWAMSCRPGDLIPFAGPKTCAGVAEGIDSHLLLGDETALPAIARFLHEAPNGTKVTAIIEVPTDADIQQLPTRADASIDWLVRGDVPAGQSSALLDAVRSRDLPDGRIFAWCAGEAITIAPIRRYLRHDRGLPREDVEVVGYWRRPADPQPDNNGDQAMVDRMAAITALHELAEVAPALIVRVAATLNVSGLLASNIDTAEKMAAELGTEADRVGSLLEAMCSIGLCTTDGFRYRNTAVGSLLVEDEAIAEFTLDNPVNRLELDIVHLAQQLRGSQTSSRPSAPTDLSERRVRETPLDTALDERGADRMLYGIDPVLQLPAMASARTILVTGDGATDTAIAIATRRTLDELVVLTDSPRVDALQAKVERAGLSRLIRFADLADPWPTVDAVLLLGTFSMSSPTQRAKLAVHAVESANAVVVALDDIRDHATTDDHVSCADLTVLAATGHPLPTSTELVQTFEVAGATQVDLPRLGWGFGTYNCTVVAQPR